MEKYIICLECGKEVIRTGGRQLYCKECKKIIANRAVNKSYYKYVERKRKEGVEHYHKNKEYYKKQNKIYSDSPVKKLNTYKNSAKRRKVEFELNMELFMQYWNKPCFYCGSEIKTIGLDRKDNNKGYVIGNIIPCCSRCNSMKSNMNTDDFINQCKQIILNQNGTK